MKRAREKSSPKETRTQVTLDATKTAIGVNLPWPVDMLPVTARFAEKKCPFGVENAHLPDENSRRLGK